MSRGLPHGRGYVQGENAKVLQQQEWARRSRENPRADGWIISSTDLGCYTNDTGSATSTGTLFLVPLPLYAEDIKLSECRFWATGAGTSANIEAAIYLYQRSPKRRLTMVAGSKVHHDISGTGIVQEKLDKEVLILAGTRYFIGVLVAGTGAPSFIEVVANQIVRIPTLTTTSMKTAIDMDSLTLSSGTAFPFVCYLSKEAAEFL